MSVIHQALRTPTGLLGLLLAAAIALVVAIGPAVWDTDPDALDFGATLVSPNEDHPLGTDTFGRDQLARLLAGGRQSLLAAAGIVTAVFVIGLLIGTTARLLGGVADTVIARIIDVTLSIPSLVFALAIVGTLGPGFANLVVALVVANWAVFARLARSLALTARDRPDVVAARLAGVGWWRRTVTHVLPGNASQLLAVATLEFGSMIVSLAGLSFLGLGAQPPAAEWGTMLSESRSVFTVAPWLLYGPVVAIFAAVTAAVLFGDALRDAADPTTTTGS